MKEVRLDVENLVKTQFDDTTIYMPPHYRSLNNTIGYERTTVKTFNQVLSPGDVFIDVGTHVGLFSVLAGKKIGEQGKVFSFEPIPENIEALKHNISFNQLNNVEIFNEALSEKSGQKTFNIRQDTGLSGFHEHPLGETIKKIKVKTSTLDERFSNKKVDLIKIDTEGHELRILKGATKTIRNNPNIKLIIELNPGSLKNAGDDPKDLLKYIIDLGFEIYFIDDIKYRTYRMTNKYKKWDKHFTDYGYVNILCVPKDNHIHPLFICHSSEPGGAGLAMVEHIEALMERGVISHVIIPSSGRIEELLKAKEISYSIVGYKFWAESSSGQEEATRNNRLNMEGSTRISLLAKDIDPTIVVNNSLVCPWGYPTAMSMQLPLVWFVHEHGDDFDFIHNINDIKKFIISRSDMIIGCSDTIKKDLLKVEKSNNIKAVYNSIDVNNIKKLSQEKVKNIYTEENSLKVCFVGRVSPSKGQIYAIRALGELKRKGLTAELALVGPVSAYYKKVVLKEIHQLGLKDRVKFLGYKENPFPYLVQADVSLVCSSNEGFGRVTAESMILAKPVIGSDKGGTVELIKHGESGLLYKSGSVADLARQIERIYKSKKLLKKLGDNAQKRIASIINKDKSSNLLIELFLQAAKPKDRAANAITSVEWIDCVDQNIKEVKMLENELSATQELLKNVEQERNNLKQQQQELLSSRSWRLTKPARKAGNFIRTAKKRKKA